MVQAQIYLTLTLVPNRVFCTTPIKIISDNWYQLLIIADQDSRFVRVEIQLQKCENCVLGLYKQLMEQLINLSYRIVA